jgi:catechol 2,3-dioxygenase-like lactoylglutathione lyase family enzyme
MATDILYRGSHCGICVEDLERSMRFYRDGLGFDVGPVYKVGSEFEASLEVDGDGEIVLISQFLSQAGMTIELLHFERPGSVGEPSINRNRRGLTHLSFEVDDVDAAAARLEAFGGSVVAGTRVGAGDPAAVQIVFLSDPDGVRVELMQTSSG